MENVCDVNHLDVDVLLPPRKRLLAGLKKQSSDGYVAASPSRVVASCATVSKAVSSSPSSYSVEFEARLKNLLSSHPTNLNLTSEEVVEASKAEAVAAVKAAKAAAEEKVEIAAKAVAAAKRALDLIASFSEEAMGSSKERNPKKNKLKKHLPVHFLYKKYQQIENCGTDEELAQKLHRAMNRCKFGDKCHFAHGEWELGKHISPSINDHRSLGPSSAGRMAVRIEPPPLAGSFGAISTAKISVEASLAGAIIGKGGVNSKQICRQTGAKLSI
ncbi:hypothetical protein V8G54_017392 [Vigna mungo]|uniref:C3H1-type domain-containing protein n=1 Tax=Vigna mungo TaxID=3915 RepID=A0AAQ3NQJ6_VIGMU